MAGSRAIKSKIQTVGNIKKITGAMEMIARTKMKRAVDGVLAMRPYALYAQELLVHLSADKKLDSVYLHQGSGNKVLAVIIAADKGLCGGYNANISRHIKKRFQNGETVEVIAIGKKAVKEARKNKFELLASYVDVPDKISLEFAAPIAKLLREKFLSGEYKSVEVIFTDYVSSLVQKVSNKTILPVSAESVASVIKESAFSEEAGEKVSELSNDYGLYIFEPSTEVILNTIVPRLVDVGLTHALFESRASEESMRMFAMKNATENAEELKNDLTLSFNRARQQGITQEIAEIAAGAGALN